MWTAKITSKNIINKTLVVDVTVANTETGITYGLPSIPFAGNLDEFKQQVSAEIQQLDVSLAKLDSLRLGDIDLSVSPQTQEQIDKDKFFANYKLYKQKLQAVEDKLLQPDDSSISDLIIILKANNKPDYGVF